MRPCRPQDRDPKRPAREQKVCLWSKKKPKKLLGRHPNKKSARKQERTIQARKRGWKPTGKKKGKR